MNFTSPPPEVPRRVVVQRIRTLATALENLHKVELKPDPVIHELLKLVKGVVETLLERTKA